MSKTMDFQTFAAGNGAVPAAETGRIVSRRASGIQPKAIDWIWTGRIARGKHTVIAGEPATNKSTLLAEIVACITTGRSWPCGEGCPPRQGRVLMLSAEDDATDTIVPRLIAAGADLDAVEIIDAVRDDQGQRSFNLTADIEKLEAAIQQIGMVDLITVDPISAYLGKTDSHKNSDVRGVLEPLQKMAERTGVGVLSVTHFSKQCGNNSTTRALHRFMGSIAFTAAARMAFAVIEDRDDPGRRMLLHVKNNLAAPPQGLAFTVQERIIDVSGGTALHPFISWESQPVTLTANEAMATDTDNDRTERDDAEDFLRELLTSGPIAAKDIKRDANDAGHSWTTIRRAKDRLGIKPSKDGMDGGWFWSLPTAPKAPTDPEDAHG